MKHRTKFFVVTITLFSSGVVQAKNCDDIFQAALSDAGMVDRSGNTKPEINIQPNHGSQYYRSSSGTISVRDFRSAGSTGGSKIEIEQYDPLLKTESKVTVALTGSGSECAIDNVYVSQGKNLPLLSVDSSFCADLAKNGAKVDLTKAILPGFDKPAKKPSCSEISEDSLHKISAICGRYKNRWFQKNSSVTGSSGTGNGAPSVGSTD